MTKDQERDSGSRQSGEKEETDRRKRSVPPLKEPAYLTGMDAYMHSVMWKGAI